MGIRKVRGFEVFFCCQSACKQTDSDCHGMTSLPLLCSPLATSNPFCLHSASSASTPLQLQCVLAQLVQLHHTHSQTNCGSIPDLVPTPRATVYIPFLHLSYLPDHFSLTIPGNYSFLV